MNQKVHGRTYINFDERPSKFMKDWNVKIFDVVIEERYHDWMAEDSDVDQNILYCNALLGLLKKVKPNYQKEFLDYQCQLLEKPAYWLRALDELIDRNNDFFYKVKCEHLIPSWHQHISDSLAIHQSVIDERPSNSEEKEIATSDLENPFDIEKVKKHQLHLPYGFKRLEYLLRMRTNYLHHRSKYTVRNYLPFHKQVKLEIEYQKFEEAFFLKEAKRRVLNKQHLTITINGSIELMAYAFKCMMDHPGYGDAPFLQMNRKEAVLFLINYVTREDGNPINRTELQSVFDIDDEEFAIIESSKLLLPTIQVEHYYLYSIDSVIDILQTIPDYDFRIRFLVRIKTNYLQHRLLKDKEREFEIRINREIAHQKKLQKMKMKKQKLSPMSKIRFRINGQINIFIQVIYELLTECKGTDDKSYLLENKKKIVRFFCKYFVDKNGSDLSPNTFYSLLKPTNGWKRCPLHKRIHLDLDKHK